MLLFPVLPFSIALSLWPHVGSLFLPAVLGTLLMTARRITNTLFHQEQEFLQLQVLAVNWTRVVVTKNLATMMVWLGTCTVLCVPNMYFAVQPPGSADVAGFGLYTATIIFPLLIFGNSRSIESPQRSASSGFPELAGSVLALIALAIVSVPYLVLSALDAPWFLATLYAVATAVLWRRGSVPRTAGYIQQHAVRFASL
jgi:hypothetical protein